MKFYGVRKGYNPGVYTSWEDCQAQTSGYPRAVYRKFDSYQEAFSFAFPQDDSSSSHPSAPSRFEGYYAVRVGRQTGVFHTWEECQDQVHGYPGAEYKKFYSRSEAQNYIDSGPTFSSYSQEYDRYMSGFQTQVSYSSRYEVTHYVPGYSSRQQAPALPTQALPTPALPAPALPTQAWSVASYHNWYGY